MAKPSPRIRKDLVAVVTTADGVSSVEVKDPVSGTTFTLYEFEYELAQQLNGQPVEDIVAWAAAFEVALTPQVVDEFAAKLAELGFLEDAGGGSPAARPTADAPASDSAEVEWNALQGANTTQFVPDPAMLSGTPPDLTPAFPLEALAKADSPDSAPTMTGFEAAAASASTPAASPPPTAEASDVFELPPDALTELTDSGRVASSGPVPAAVKPGLSGGFSSGYSSTHSSGISSTTERRQPPVPDSVVMTPFEDVSRRFRAPPPERQRSMTSLLGVVLLMVVVGGGGGAYYWMRQHPKLPQALRLRVVAPQPTAVYRWFATAGTVVDLEARTMAFESAGKVAELRPAGAKFAAGDTLGKLQGAVALEAELGKLKSKLAYFEQLRDSIKASGNKANLRDAEDKVAVRAKALSDMQASLNKLLLKAPEAGAIGETMVKVGAVVTARAPAVKWRGRNLHGDFTMDQEDFTKASKLDFCRVEVAGFGAGSSPSPSPTSPKRGTPAPTTSDAATAPTAVPPPGAGQGELRFVDCTLPPPTPVPPGGPSLLRKFIVTLPSEAGLMTGQQLHLARKRFDGIFPLPLSAVRLQTDIEAQVWIAAPNGTAEQRPVTVAESRDEVLISHGLNVGDEIIVEPPRDLQPGTLVEPIR
jgi:multidrug efflux pump subunit AcrA (membrane-fusion protein)